MVIGLSHLAFRVNAEEKDLENVIFFYEKGLGLELYCQGTDAAVFHAEDGTAIELLKSRTGSKEKIRFAFEVPDTDAAVRKAESLGAIRRKEPMTENGIRTGILRTPSGEEIEFRQYEDCPLSGFLIGPSVPVREIERGELFLRSLGLETVEKEDGRVRLGMNDSREIELTQTTEDAVSGFSHLCLLTDDLESTLSAATEAGASVEVPVFEWEGRKTVFLFTPCGFTLELCEEKGENPLFPHPAPRKRREVSSAS